MKFGGQVSGSLGRRASGDDALRSVGNVKKATRGGARGSRGLRDDDASPQTETGDGLEGTEAQPRATDGEDNFQRLLDRESKWLTYGVRMPFIKHVAPIYGARDAIKFPPPSAIPDETSHAPVLSHFFSPP